MIPVGKAMDEAKLQKYKTVLCQRMLRSGTCRYGLQCDFAHDKLELRRNLQQHWYYGQKCTKESCEDNECRYAHNDMELLYHPHIFKTQLCHSIAFGPCLKKHYCPFAHGPEELRQGKLETEEDPSGESRLFFSNFSSESKTTTTTTTANGTFTGSANSILHPAPASEFREVTDRLKIQLLDLVDEISSMHFDHARSQHKIQNLEQLSQLDADYFTSLPPADLDIVASQCHAVLDLIAQAKEHQKQEEEEMSVQVKICD